MRLKLSKKKIYLVGLGITGLSLIKNLLENKIEFYCWDDDRSKRSKLCKKTIQILPPTMVEYQKIDFLVLSPGIPNDHLSLIFASKKKCKIISDIELLNYVDIDMFKIGITGTNGKSTTTKLIENTLKLKNKNTFSAGNIGTPFWDLKTSSKNKNTIILESSSYQLEKTKDLSFDISVLLNLSKDHLDRHKSMEKYLEAKLNIFKNQKKKDYAIICTDDSWCKDVAFSFRNKFNSTLYKLSANDKNKVDFYIKKSEKNVHILDNTIDEEFIFSNKFVKILGQHNLINILCCYVVCKILNIEKIKFLDSIKKFKGLEHRFEFFKKYKNVSFYNDSKSTNVSSSKVALDNLKNIFWLVGGKKKTGGILGIKGNLKYVEKAFIYGECKDEFNNYLSKYLDTEVFSSLEDAIKKSIHSAVNEKKDINLLLSPASASFDEFKDFEERGKYFKKVVNNLIRN